MFVILNKTRDSVMNVIQGPIVTFPQGSYGFDILKIGRSGDVTDLSPSQLYKTGLAKLVKFNNPDKKVYSLGSVSGYDLTSVTDGTVSEIRVLNEVADAVDNLKSEIKGRVDALKRQIQMAGMIWQHPVTGLSYGVHTDSDSRDLIDGALAAAKERGVTIPWTVREVVTIDEIDYKSDKVNLELSLEHFTAMALAVADHWTACHSAALAHKATIDGLDSDVDVVKEYTFEDGWPASMPLETPPT